MNNSSVILSTVGASVITMAGTLWAVQQGQPAAPPGTNPQPPQVQPPATRPNTPPPSQPGPATNQPVVPGNPNQPGQPGQPLQPGQVVPGQPLQPGQVAPGQPLQPGDALLPAFPDPNDPNLTPEQRDMINRLRQQQPFTFQSPQAEMRFNDSARRLARQEQRLALANQEQLRRLGEIRALSPERQTGALLDLLQQLLTSQRDIQRQIVATRTMFTGEFDTATEPTTAQQPTQNPGVAPIR